MDNKQRRLNQLSSSETRFMTKTVKYFYINDIFYCSFLVR